MHRPMIKASGVVATDKAVATPWRGALAPYGWGLWSVSRLRTDEPSVRKGAGPGLLFR